MIDFAKYFDLDHEVYLESINYKKLDDIEVEDKLALDCIDNIKADIINEDQVKIIFIRSLKFDPECLFELKVAFGAVFNLNKEYKEEVEWSKIDLSEELRKSGDNVLGEIISRVSLQIAEITSSFGQSPIITPPIVAGN